MRRIVVLGVAAGSVISVALACTSSSLGPAPASPGSDAAIPPGQPLGAPCDPSLPSPCAPGGNACAVVACDESSSTCAESPSDAPCGGDDGGSVADASAGAPCTSDTGCSGGERCAYLVTLGCSAQGACVLPSAPTTADGGPVIACGCDGMPVVYVTPLATNEPAASPSACVDASIDASADSSSLDASDASTE